MIDYYLSIFKTRSFSKEPLRTIHRGINYLIYQTTGRATIFKINFADSPFVLQLQAAKRHFGAAGIFIQRQYYETLLEYGWKLMDQGEVAIDGGASQGVFTCAFAARVGESGHVYAFEPLEYAAECIRVNVNLNQFHNVTIHQAALAAKSARVSIDLSRGPNSASIVSPLSVHDVANVSSVAIDHLREKGQLRPAQFIKLDVEGAELIAIQGAQQTIRSDRPRICIEALDEGGFGRVEALLTSMNPSYRTYIFDEKGSLQKFSRFVPSANVFFLPD